MSKDALETEMESSEDDKKHEHNPLLSQEKGMDSFKYADDDDEETELKDKKTADESVEEKTMSAEDDAPDLSKEVTTKQSSKSVSKSYRMARSRSLESDKAAASKDETSLLLQKTEMDASEDEDKREGTALLSQETELKQKKTADDSVEETALTSEDMENMEMILEELKELQKPMAAKDGARDLSEEKTKTKENKSLDEGAENIENNSRFSCVQETVALPNERIEMAMNPNWARKQLEMAQQLGLRPAIPATQSAGVPGVGLPSTVNKESKVLIKRILQEPVKEVDPLDQLDEVAEEDMQKHYGEEEERETVERLQKELDMQKHYGEEEERETVERLQKELENLYEIFIQRYDRHYRDELNIGSYIYKDNAWKLLDKYGVNATTFQDRHNNTLFHYIVMGNYLGFAGSKGIESPATINTQNSLGLTPLHLAALLGYSEMAKELIKKKADLNLQDNEGNTPLLIAVKYGCPEVFEILYLAKACVDKADKQENSVLHCATARNRPDILKKLLNCEDKARCADFVRLLKSKDKNEKTALHVAAQNGFLECVKILLKKDKEWTIGINACSSEGKYINLRCSKKQTALHYAVISNRENIVEVLLQEDAHRHCKDKEKRTPLSYAAEKGLAEITMKLVARVETDRTADPGETDRTDDRSEIDKAADQDGMTAAHYAAQKNHSEVLHILLEDSVVVAKTKDGRNCLDIAVDNKNVEAALEIIKSKKWEEFLRNEIDYQSPMRKLILHMPDVAMEVFNKCTILDGTAVNFSVTFNFEFLDDTLLLGGWKQNECSSKPYTKDEELIKKNHPLMIMVTNKRAELLDHPLVSALLKKKWTSIGRICYLVNLLLYMLYLTALTGFAVGIKAPYQLIDVSTNATQDRIPDFETGAKYCVIVLTAIEILIEIMELRLIFSCSVCSFIEWEKFVQWIAYILSIIFVSHPSGSTDMPEWIWSCGTVAVFLAWINLLIRIKKIEWIGIYVEMLFQVCKVFMAFFLFVLSPLVLAFAITFYCLFRNQEQFNTFWISFVKTTEMMTGELDYKDIFLDEEKKVHFNNLSHVVFYIFMLFMTIVGVNLMIGLAVNNIREFQTKAGFEQKKMQVKVALELERLSRSSIFCKCLRPVHSDQNENDRQMSESNNMQNGRIKEIIYPNKQSWLPRKIGKSWNLTEKDIRQALTSGTHGFSKEITKLKREMRNMDSELMSELNKVEGTTKDIQEEMTSIELRLMYELKKIEETTKE